MTTDYTNDTDPEKTCLLFLTVGLLALPVALRAQREKLPPADLEFVEKNWPEAKKTTNGIRYIIVREGKDDSPKTGDRVFVLYVGRLLDGKIFDQNEDRAHPFEFRLRRDMVIQGWEQVLQLMKRGEKRLAIIPPELAYGTRGQPPKIPRNATLVFEIELIDFRKD